MTNNGKITLILYIFYLHLTENNKLFFAQTVQYKIDARFVKFDVFLIVYGNAITPLLGRVSWLLCWPFILVVVVVRIWFKRIHLFQIHDMDIQHTYINKQRI